MFDFPLMDPASVDRLITQIATKMQDTDPTDEEYYRLVANYSTLVKLRLDLQASDTTRGKILIDQENAEAQRIFDSEENSRTREAAAEASKDRLKKGEMLAIGANLLGVVLVLHHEKLNVIPKALAWIKKV